MYFDVFSGILSNVLSGILSDVLSDIYFGIRSDILSEILPDILSGILSGLYDDILTGYLASILAFLCSARSLSSPWLGTFGSCTFDPHLAGEKKTQKTSKTKLWVLRQALDVVARIRSMGEPQRCATRCWRFYHLRFSDLIIWLVVDLPLWKIWVRQWEGWHPIYEMENKTWLKPPSRYSDSYNYSYPQKK